VQEKSKGYYRWQRCAANDGGGDGPSLFSRAMIDNDELARQWRGETSDGGAASRAGHFCFLKVVGFLMRANPATLFYVRARCLCFEWFAEG
jgi:hypothetical protein